MRAHQTNLYKRYDKYGSPADGFCIATMNEIPEEYLTKEERLYRERMLHQAVAYNVRSAKEYLASEFQRRKISASLKDTERIKINEHLAKLVEDKDIMQQISIINSRIDSSSREILREKNEGEDCRWEDD